MASRLLLRLRAGASAAAQSARGHHFSAGRTGAPAMAATTGAVADAGSFSGGIPSLQGARHYGTPSNHSVVEVNRATGKVQGRLEKKCDIGHKGSVQKVLKKHGKEDGSSGIKYEFDRFANVVMVVGYGITFSVVMYYHFPWSWL